MRSISRKWKAIIGLLSTALVVFYLEFLSYVINSGSWVTLPDHFINGRKAEPVRVLFVADPQIQGEKDEPPFLGIFTRWDADRYLKRTYSLAKFHVKPDVIVFMGDLFDEGSTASADEYQRYYTRFSSIFDIPGKAEASGIKYVFIPGDNDVGGESYEPVSQEKLRWFGRTFGNYSEPVSIQRSNWDVQFVKYNKFLPGHGLNPLKGMDHILSRPDPTIRILISHFSVLHFITESFHSAMNKLKPSLIFGAHDHVSSYYRLNYGTQNSIHTSLRKNFLSPVDASRVTSSSSGGAPTVASDSIFQYFQMNMMEAKKEKSIHEIDLPTSSYRMGVSAMGYGELNVYEDGEMYYTVLWSPSRFRQLYVYLVAYVISKIIFTPWAAYKIVMYTWTKYKRYRQERNGQYHPVGSFEKSNGMKMPRPE